MCGDLVSGMGGGGGGARGRPWVVLSQEGSFLDGGVSRGTGYSKLDSEAWLLWGRRRLHAGPPSTGQDGHKHGGGKGFLRP